VNEEELHSTLDAATAGVEPRAASFGAVAAAGRRRRRRQRALSGLAAVAVVAVVVTGAAALAGSGDEDSLQTVDRPSTTTTTDRQPTTTSTTTTEGTTPTAPTVAPPAPRRPSPHPTVVTNRPPPLVAARPVNRPAAVGDVDGDAVTDAVTIEPAGQGRAVVRARLSALGAQELTTDVTDVQSLAVMGISDIDADGFGEVFLRVGQGASTSFAGLLRLVDDHLVRVNADPSTGGGPATFEVDGSVTHLGSLQCVVESDWLTWTEATPTGPDLATYTVRYTTAALEGDHLSVRSESSETVPADQVMTGVVDCDGIPERW
jgi:hypothetical protein